MLRLCCAVLLAALLAGCQLSPIGEATATTEPTVEMTPEPTAEATLDLTAEIVLPTPELTDEAGVSLAQADITTPASTETDAEIETETPDETDTATEQPAAEATPSPTPEPQPGAGVIAWLRDEAQIARIEADGSVIPLIDMGRAPRAALCGTPFTVPNEKQVLYIGGESGTLYLIDGENVPQPVADAAYLACIAAGAVRFNADETQLGYIDYATSAARGEYAEGTLRIVDGESFDEITTFDGVTAFTFAEGGAALIRFFTDQQGAADEAAVSVWDGESENAREVVTLTPTDEGCRFTGAQLGAVDPLVAVMSQRCTGDGITRLVYTIDAENGSASLIASGSQTGVFAPFSGTNNVFAQGDQVYFTIPDGVTAFTAGLASLDVSEGDITTVIERQIVLPNFSGTDQALPARSANGERLGVAIGSPNNENALALVDLTGENAPLRVSAGSRGDTVTNLAFAGDVLLYTAGGQDNALWVLDPAVGVESRVARGMFGAGMVVSPSGDAVIVVDQRDGDPILSQIELESGEKTTYYEGNALPLAWVGE